MSRIEGIDFASGGDTRPERVLRGSGVSPGFALGPAWISDTACIPAPEIRIAAESIEAEIRRFENAVALSRQQLETLKLKSRALPAPAADEVGFLVDAHLGMLGHSRLVRGVYSRIRKAGINAEAAIRHELQALADAFAVMDDPYLAGRFDDIRIVAGRVIRNLTNVIPASINALPPGTVLLAEELVQPKPR